jgi:hypothetical protein
MIKTASLLTVLFGVTITPLWAQNFGMGNVAMFPGAGHRPVIVKDEFAHQVPAVLVYDDKESEAYAPEVADDYNNLRTMKFYGNFCHLPLHLQQNNGNDRMVHNPC